MNFNKHYNLKDKHAFLSASKYHWINYDLEKLESAWTNHEAAKMGTRLHAHAAECINLGTRLKQTNKTLNMYVNDAIGFKMQTEQILYYSDNCFGTADAISFRKEMRTGRNTLRIHDYKSGSVPAHMEQLEIYAALFCLEYRYDPEDIDMELRLYQNDQVVIHNPSPESIKSIMDTIVAFDKAIDKWKVEE